MNLEWVDKIVGLRSWGSRIGYAGFVSIELGQEWATDRNHKRGHWSIWVAGADWRILLLDRLVTCSSDSNVLTEDIDLLNNLVLKDVVVSNPAQGASFVFSEGIIFETFVNESGEENEIVVMSKLESFFINGDGSVGHEQYDEDRNIDL